MTIGEKDHILAQGLLEGNREALEELYVMYAPRVRFFISHYTRNSSDAEDLTHDVFLKIWNKRSTIRIEDSLSSLIFTMARNAVLDAVKHRKVKDRYVEQQRVVIGQQVHDIESSIHAREELSELERKMENLTDRQRRVFEMSRVEGKTYEEIAGELKISEKTVQYHISQALKDLRKS